VSGKKKKKYEGAYINPGCKRGSEKKNATGKRGRSLTRKEAWGKGRS